MAKQKLIIDTDPGCDDVLALLLALTSNPDDVEIVLISVTYGNVPVKSCLQNVVSTFHVIEKEREWRKQQSLPDCFEMLSRHKPVVAVGADGPLGGQTMQADYYHGIDGLGGVSESHPHHTLATETWSHLFEPSPPKPPDNDPIVTTAASTTHTNPPSTSHLFTPSPHHAVDSILSLLSNYPPNTITLIALGPLTNFALAAARSPQTFLRAKSLLVMGGALNLPGNITPVGEFNTIADPIAAARIYALTSPDPRTTMPPLETEGKNSLAGYPPVDQLGSNRLKVVLFPLDITTPHMLRQRDMESAANAGLERGSPLAEWVTAFTGATFSKNAELERSGMAEMALHDPVVVWDAITGREGWEVSEGRDVRVETAGQWTKGMCVVDRRGRKVMEKAKGKSVCGSQEVMEEVSGDKGGWLSEMRGNRVGVCVGTPGVEECGRLLLERIFGGL